MATLLGDIWDTAIDVAGNVFGDWAGADGTFGLDSTFGFGPQPQAGFIGPAVAPGFNAPLQTEVINGGNGGICPPMPPGPPPPPGGCNGMNDGPSPVWKKVCGVYKWVYPKRRRRKQLLTKSDATGLAQLKGIVGSGKVMETWIATHPS